jgi:hypothetical protein
MIIIVIIVLLLCNILILNNKIYKLTNNFKNNDEIMKNKYEDEINRLLEIIQYYENTIIINNNKVANKKIKINKYKNLIDENNKLLENYKLLIKLCYQYFKNKPRYDQITQDQREHRYISQKQGIFISDVLGLGNLIFGMINKYDDIKIENNILLNNNILLYYDNIILCDQEKEILTSFNNNILSIEGIINRIQLIYITNEYIKWIGPSEMQDPHLCQTIKPTKIKINIINDKIIFYYRLVALENTREEQIIEKELKLKDLRTFNFDLNLMNSYD